MNLFAGICKKPQSSALRTAGGLFARAGLVAIKGVTAASLGLPVLREVLAELAHGAPCAATAFVKAQQPDAEAAWGSASSASLAQGRPGSLNGILPGFAGRVEIWRGGPKAPFPDPAHQTGRADLPHPAFGQGCCLAFAHGRLF